MNESQSSADRDSKSDFDPESAESLQSQQASESNSSPVKRVLDGLKWTGVVGGFVAVLLSVLDFVLGTPELRLTVWERDVYPLYPSEATGGSELPFELRGKKVRSAAVVSFEVSNTGKRMIGKEEKTWQLKFKSSEGSALLLVGAPETEPLDDLVKEAKAIQGIALLAMRAIQPRASVRVRLLLVNAKDPENPEIDAIPGMEGVPLERTHLSPHDRNIRRLFPWFLTVFAVALGIVVVIERRSLGARGLKKPSIGESCGQFVLGTLFFSYLAASGLGWLVALFQ